MTGVALPRREAPVPKETSVRPRVGLVLRDQDLARYRGRFDDLSRDLTAADIDYVALGDHVSFLGGAGVDALVAAASLLSCGLLSVQTCVYLLPLRHPTVIARQLSTLSVIAPGRFTFGVGVGGDDRSEVFNCGVDPATRGARADEALEIIGRLLTGQSLTWSGRFFSLNRACILPPPDPPIPILIGGRSDAALRRTARYGAGWVAVWVSPERFRRAQTQVSELAAAAGRKMPIWSHTLSCWVGFGQSVAEGRDRVAPVMEASYDLPYVKFGKYTFCGTPSQVAQGLVPYVEAGCAQFSLTPESEDFSHTLEAVGQVKRELLAFLG